MPISADAFSKFSARDLTLGQPVILDATSIPIDPAVFGMLGQPVRRGRREGVERGPQHLTHVL